MIEQWGHRIVRLILSPSSHSLTRDDSQADRPTEKSFRSSYRASVHGSLVHDASYYQYIILKGEEDNLRRLLESVCDPIEVSPGSLRSVLAAHRLS